MTSRRLSIAGLAAAAAMVGALAALAWSAAMDDDATLPLPTDYAATVVSDGGSSEQNAALQDGEVTLAEYEEAVDRTVACAAARGVKVELQEGTDRMPSSIGFAADTMEAAERAKAELDACRTQFLGAIETTWALQQAALPASEIQAAHALLSECMVDRGTDLADGFFSVDDVNALFANRDRSEAGLQLLHAYQVCSQSVERELGYNLP